MKLKFRTILVAIILIVGELNCQSISDNNDNLLINKNRDITLPNNNNNNNNNSNSDNSNSSSSSSSSSSESNDSELINNNSNSDDNNNKTDVPLIFPDDSKNYKILSSVNATIIKKLLHQNGDSSEIADLNKAPSTETIPLVKSEADENKIILKKTLDESLNPKLLTGRNLKLKPTSTSIKPTLKNGDYYEDDYSSGEEVYKDDVENVQEKNTKKPKIELEEQFERHGDIKSEQQLPVDMQDIDNPMQEKTTDPSPSNSVLFIVIVVTVAFICTGIYLSLFVWRRKLEGRYGMRERLVTNEDDVFDDDVHYRNQQQFGASITVREIC